MTSLNIATYGEACERFEPEALLNRGLKNALVKGSPDLYDALSRLVFLPFTNLLKHQQPPSPNPP